MRTLFAVLICAASLAASAADSDEATIRRLDDAERLAVLSQDLPSLEKLMAKDVVVHNPENRVLVGRDAVFERVRNGRIRYRLFERTVDLVRVDGDIGFVMGGETVVPKTDAPNGPTTLHRRFTNVWRRIGDTWQLIARQSSIVGRD